jgi:hypothetical protein
LLVRVGGELDLLVLLDEAEKRPQKTPNHSIVILKMATTMFAETLGNFQH